MVIISSLLHSLCSASRASKRVLLGFKKSGKTKQNSDSQKQKENLSVSLVRVVPQGSSGTSNCSTTSLLSSERKMSTGTSLVETSSAASRSQSGHPSIFSLTFQNYSQVPSPTSSIGTSPSLLDSEDVESAPKKRFVRIQPPVRDCQPTQGFSVHQNYYYDYLPQFEEVKAYTPCQSDTLRSVFEDDSEDEREDKRKASEKKKKDLKKNTSQRS